MAKNFAMMPTKKLKALLATASEEDAAAIQEVLNARGAVGTQAPAAASAALTEEEAEALAAAEGDKAEKPEAEKKEKPAKLTDEQRKAIADEARAKAMNHRCHIVPFNSIDWVDGTVVGVIEEKRTNKVLYAVKTDDGRRIVKAYGSNLIEILDEVVEAIKKERGSKKQKLDENGNPIESKKREPLGEWSDEEIAAAIDAVIGNVGKVVTYPKVGAMGKTIEGAGEESGRIIGLVPAKRTHEILYRIEVEPKKYAHKVASNASLKLSDIDEVGQKLNEAYVAKRNGEPRVKLTPEELVERAKAAVEKAEAYVAKAQETLAKRKQAYEEALAALNTGGSSETESEDLM